MYFFYVCIVFIGLFEMNKMKMESKHEENTPEKRKYGIGVGDKDRHFRNENEKLNFKIYYLRMTKDACFNWLYLVLIALEWKGLSILQTSFFIFHTLYFIRYGLWLMVHVKYQH